MCGIAGCLTSNGLINQQKFKNALDYLDHRGPDDTGIEDFETVTATIYNWKMGYIPTEEYDWHIGGFSSDAVDCVYKKLDKATVN